MLALGTSSSWPLVYVQTVERALGTAFFVVVPLAALFLARAPLAWGLAAAVTNGLLTLRVGLSAALAAAGPYLLALAAIVGLATTIRVLAGSRSGSVALTGFVARHFEQVEQRHRNQDRQHRQVVARLADRAIHQIRHQKQRDHQRRPTQECWTSPPAEPAAPQRHVEHARGRRRTPANR